MSSTSCGWLLGGREEVGNPFLDDSALLRDLQASLPASGRGR